MRDCSPFTEIFAQLDRIEQKLDDLQRSVDAVGQQRAESRPKPPVRREQPSRRERPIRRELPTIDQPGAYLTRREVSEMLGFSPKTLANWASENRGPKCVRVGGGHCRYRLADVLAWQEAQHETSPPT
ncbi:helix-turn-helix transcriptional regulator [Nocardia sp. Marseille-Q1738]